MFICACMYGVGVMKELRGCMEEVNNPQDGRWAGQNVIVVQWMTPVCPVSSAACQARAEQILFLDGPVPVKMIGERWREQCGGKMEECRACPMCQR